MRFGANCGVARPLNKEAGDARMEKSMAELSLRPNSLIGEYLLEELVGHGASGVVWKAHHHVWPARKAAIKVFTNDSFIGSVRREGVIHDDLTQLASSHIVKLLGINILAPQP